MPKTSSSFTHPPSVPGLYLKGYDNPEISKSAANKSSKINDGIIPTFHSSKVSCPWLICATIQTNYSLPVAAWILTFLVSIFLVITLKNGSFLVKSIFFLVKYRMPWLNSIPSRYKNCLLGDRVLLDEGASLLLLKCPAEVPFFLCWLPWFPNLLRQTDTGTPRFCIGFVNMLFFHSILDGKSSVFPCFSYFSWPFRRYCIFTLW